MTTDDVLLLPIITVSFCTALHHARNDASNNKHIPDAARSKCRKNRLISPGPIPVHFHWGPVQLTRSSCRPGPHICSAAEAQQPKVCLYSVPPIMPPIGLQLASNRASNCASQMMSVIFTTVFVAKALTKTPPGHFSDPLPSTAPSSSRLTRPLADTGSPAVKTQTHGRLSRLLE